ncbi:MAG: DUF1643 domain-containing protein [Burkholderiales bacterium]|nr:DUF1643 domain-containing protein [Burkholderiales bacterium]
MTPAGASFSRGRRYRYLLWRRWGEGPAANFVMLNPSTADERRLDPSCTRARNYARRWGYGAVIVTNLFALRATDPARLRRARAPAGGRANDRAILAAARAAALVVCAWGNHGAFAGRSAKVVCMLERAGIRLHVLRLTAAGEPAHPLYLPAALAPRPWRRPRPQTPL